MTPMAACGGKDQPARVVEKFLEAIAENDLAALQETVDPDVADEVMAMMYFQIGLQGLVGGDVEFVELESEGDAYANHRNRTAVESD